MAVNQMPIITSRTPLTEGLHVAECVASDGSTQFWLVDQSDKGAAYVRIPAHEREGRLPADYAKRLKTIGSM